MTLKNCSRTYADTHAEIIFQNVIDRLQKIVREERERFKLTSLLAIPVCYNKIYHFDTMLELEDWTVASETYLHNSKLCNYCRKLMRNLESIAYRRSRCDDGRVW